MLNSKKRGMLNRMNSTANAVKLGDIMPMTVSVKITAGDILSGVVTIDTGMEFTCIAGVTVISSAGVCRVVTKAVKNESDSKKLDITATSIAAGDTVTVTVA